MQKESEEFFFEFNHMNENICIGNHHKIGFPVIRFVGFRVL